jgi:hypothetical protein
VDFIGKDFLEHFDRELLKKSFCEVSGYEDAALLGWDCRSVRGGFDMASSIYRLTGKALVSRKCVPWFVILKIKNMVAGASIDPEGVRFWNREAMAYQTGFLANLPKGLSAPKCYGVFWFNEQETWIWIEDLKDDFDGKWSEEQYAVVARQLGLFNGAYLSHEPIPGESWLSRNWLRKYVEGVAPLFSGDFLESERVLVRKFLPNEHMKDYAQCWKTRNQFLDAIDHLLKCLCHQDAFRRNLFLREKESSELEISRIDWTYMGIATIGLELAPLVGMAVFEGDISPKKISSFIDQIIGGYLEGIREMGGNVDEDQVRYCILATWLYRYALGALSEFFPFLLNGVDPPPFEQAFSEPEVDFFEHIDLIGSQFRWLYSEVERLLSTCRL